MTRLLYQRSKGHLKLHAKEPYLPDEEANSLTIYMIALFGKDPVDPSDHGAKRTTAEDSAVAETALDLRVSSKKDGIAVGFDKDSDSSHRTNADTSVAETAAIAIHVVESRRENSKYDYSDSNERDVGILVSSEPPPPPPPPPPSSTVQDPSMILEETIESGIPVETVDLIESTVPKRQVTFSTEEPCDDGAAERASGSAEEEPRTAPLLSEKNRSVAERPNDLLDNWAELFGDSSFLPFHGKSSKHLFLMGCL